MPTKLIMEIEGEEVLADVQRMRLLPGDVVVIKVQFPLTGQQSVQIGQYVKARLPAHEVLVLDSQIGIEVWPAGGKDGAH